MAPGTVLYIATDEQSEDYFNILDIRHGGPFRTLQLRDFASPPPYVLKSQSRGSQKVCCTFICVFILHIIQLTPQNLIPEGQPGMRHGGPFRTLQLKDCASPPPSALNTRSGDTHMVCCTFMFLFILHIIQLTPQHPSPDWPLHDIAIANIVWCMAYTRGGGRGEKIAH